MADSVRPSTPRIPAMLQPAASWAGPALLAILVIFAAFVFQEGLLALFTAWQLAEYSHGPLIPLLSAFLFLGQLKRYPPRPGAVPDRWPGVVLLVFALMIALAGKIARIDDIVAYGMIVAVGAILLISFGWSRGRHFWPGVLHLVFMLPLPATLYWKLSINLQLISSELGVMFVQLAGVPVILDGNIIDLGVYKLHVAEACSGLRYLFPIMSFSYVFATLYKGPVWHKVVLLISAAPITVLMNSVRIGIVGVMVDTFGIEHAEGLSHFLEGWVIFITCVVMLFGLAWAMLALQKDRMTLTEALDLDFSGLGPQLARLRLVQPSGALAIATALFGAAAIGWHLAPDRAAPEIERRPLALMPQRLGDWSLHGMQVLEPRIEQALGADDYFSASFSAAPGEPTVDLFVAWYRDQTQGGIHSPEVCLPGGGWEMASLERVDIAPQLGLAEALPVNRAVIQKGFAQLLVYYWFEQSGGRVASDYLAKASLLADAVIHGRSDGALVRVITPIGPGETVAEAGARLDRFVPPLLEQLPNHVPRR